MDRQVVDAFSGFHDRREGDRLDADGKREN